MTVTVKWLGHAGFEIDTSGKIIYVDVERHSFPVRKADFILVTHAHSDHCNTAEIEKIQKDGTLLIAPRNCASKISGDIKSLKPGEETTIDGIRVKAVHAYNVKRFRAPGRPFHPKDSGVGYLITAEGKTIYHAGDTDFIPEMKDLGHIDLALLPSGDTYTMNNLEAAEAARVIKPTAVVPMHRWDTDAKKFQNELQEQPGINVVLLQEGEKYKLP